jgi:YD repeat-containing protein
LVGELLQAGGLRVTGYTVNGLGNLTQQQSPDTGTTTSTYDSAGNLTLITFHDGSKQTYAYDQGTYGIGRLSSISETNPANNVTSQIAYAYDLHGRVTSETRTVPGAQYATGYGYSSGRLTGIIYPTGRTITYTLDALGRVSQIDTAKNGQSQIVVSGVAYHPFGGVKGFTFGNGQTYTRSIDQDGRIASYTLGAQTFAIGYDAASRIVFISESGNPSNTNTYGYDALDRLTRAATPTTSDAYDYDAGGNRTVSASAYSYEISPTSNRIDRITPMSGPVRSFAYDNNGSTTADGNKTYTYDVRGRMVQATSSIGTTVYEVNALGQRTRKSNALGESAFLYDTGGRLIADLRATGEMYLYPMDGLTIKPTEGYIGRAPEQDWQIVGIADFDADHKADILWRNFRTGQNYLYPMDGRTIKPTEGYIRSVVDMNWKIVGIGDFNGDGSADILWRNSSTGENYIYLMNGTSVLTEGYIRTIADQSWKIAGIRDFDGDGKADVLWRNSATGQNYIYFMDGLTIKPTEGYIRTVADTAWTVAGVGDLDGDGTATASPTSCGGTP